MINAVYASVVMSTVWYMKLCMIKVKIPTVWLPVQQNVSLSKRKTKLTSHNDFQCQAG